MKGSEEGFLEGLAMGFTVHKGSQKAFVEGVLRRGFSEGA